MLHDNSEEINRTTSKLNQIRQKQACALTKYRNTYNTKSTHLKKLKPGLVAYDILPGNGVGLLW